MRERSQYKTTTLRLSRSTHLPRDSTTAALKSACSSEDNVNFKGDVRADISIDEKRAMLAFDNCCEFAEPPLILLFLAGTSILLLVCGATM